MFLPSSIMKIITLILQSVFDVFAIVSRDIFNSVERTQYSRKLEFDSHGLERRAIRQAITSDTHLSNERSHTIRLHL